MSSDVQLTSPSGPRRCSIAGALEVVGDRWALLVVRELGMGARRFDAIQRNTGAPRDVLTARLRKLEDRGILRREPYSEHPPRFEYLLTDAGAALAPILLTLREWGDRYVYPDDPPLVLEHSCGQAFHSRITCVACHQPITGEDLTVVDNQR
jgi:DNA-binding HxlR family transcriptional regulator